MSRDDGFSRADIDVGLYDDPKVRRLVRGVADEGTVARCLVAYQATVLASWERGERVALEDAAPLWMTSLDDLRARLVDVGLLDDDGRVPGRAWTEWYGAAFERRERGRERQRRADVKRGRTGRQSDSPTGSTGPSGATDRPTDRQAGPSPDQRRSNVGVTTEGECRICGGHVRGSDYGVRVGQGWIEHEEHPDDRAAA